MHRAIPVYAVLYRDKNGEVLAPFFEGAQRRKAYETLAEDSGGTSCERLYASHHSRFGKRSRRLSSYTARFLP